jgi:hypothetical protein
MSDFPIPSVRIACDSEIPGDIIDLNTGATAAFDLGMDFLFQLGFFADKVFQGIDNLASVQVEVRAVVAGGQPPPATQAPLMSVTLLADQLTPGCTLDQWNGGTSQQAVAEFSAEQTANCTPGPVFLTIWAWTDDEPAKPIKLCAGIIRVRNPGGGAIVVPVAAQPAFYTAAQVTSLLAAQLAAILQNTIQILNLAGLVGSGPTFLSGLTTAGKTGQVFRVIIPGQPVQDFQVQADSAATNTAAPANIRGPDFDAATNPTQFVQIA